MAVDDAPEAIRFRGVRRAFVHHAGSAVLQRPIDDIAVAGDPSDVGGAPVDVVFLDVENPFCGDVSTDRIAAGGVDDALRLTGGSRGVEDVKGMLGVERLGGAI